MGISSKYAVELVKYFKTFNKNVRINTVITNQTLYELIELVDFCAENEIKEFFTNVYLDNNRNDNLIIRSFVEYRIIKEDILNYIKQKNYDINFQLQGCLMFSAYSDRQFYLTNEYDYIRYGCEAGNTKIEIMPNGDVYPCASFKVDDFIYQNCLDKTVKDIWDNADYFHLLRNFKNKDKRCMDCDFYKFCKGGCLSENIKNYKSIELKGDLRCSILQKKA